MKESDLIRAVADAVDLIHSGRIQEARTELERLLPREYLAAIQNGRYRRPEPPRLA